MWVWERELTEHLQRMSLLGLGLPMWLPLCSDSSDSCTQTLSLLWPLLWHYFSFSGRRKGNQQMVRILGRRYARLILIALKAPAQRQQAGDLLGTGAGMAGWSAVLEDAARCVHVQSRRSPSNPLRIIITVL